MAASHPSTLYFYSHNNPVREVRERLLQGDSVASLAQWGELVSLRCSPTLSSHHTALQMFMSHSGSTDGEVETEGYLTGLQSPARIHSALKGVWEYLCPPSTTGLRRWLACWGMGRNSGVPRRGFSRDAQGGEGERESGSGSARIPRWVFPASLNAAASCLYKSPDLGPWGWTGGRERRRLSRSAASP